MTGKNATKKQEMDDINWKSCQIFLQKHNQKLNELKTDHGTKRHDKLQEIL